MMALINNWDIKDSNNEVLHFRGREGDVLVYIISDLGATFGHASGTPLFWRITRSRNNPKNYAKSDFLKKVKGNRVELKYGGKNSGLFKNITVDDAVFVQVATPSRERVDQYRILRDDIDRLVGRINGDLGRIGRPVISYLHSSYPRQEMAALYRAADIMVVTPFRDGMNLVSKEYVACRYEEDGAIVRSEFAGAAGELKQAFLVNPYDINGMKAQMLEAYHADPKDLAKRMRAMRKTIAENDVAHWAAAFLKDLGATRPPHAKKVRPARRS